ncbi:hypothetical protein P3T22_003431 [Paraburkholderia sp. GAS348]
MQMQMQMQKQKQKQKTRQRQKPQSRHRMTRRKRQPPTRASDSVLNEVRLRNTVQRVNPTYTPRRFDGLPMRK